MTRALLEQIIGNQPIPAGLPVPANIEVGHTFPMAPMATFPIGGRSRLTVGADQAGLVLLRH
jgi:muramoyltetrapeptide carboxypeptidase